MEEKLIVVCSKNKAKNEAVKNIIKNYFENFNIISLNTNSGISETPMSDDEGIKGCLNRIDDARKQVNNGDLYVAMEGILTKNFYGTFLCGWTVIYNKKCEEYYYGCSSKVKVLDEILLNFNKDSRLSDIVAKYCHSTESEISILGTNGVITNGAYTRTDEFTDSILCAISTKFNRLN